MSADVGHARLARACGPLRCARGWRLRVDAGARRAGRRRDRRDRVYRRAGSRASSVLYVRSAAMPAADGRALVRRARSPTSTGFARFSTTAARGVADRTAQELRPAVSAARHHDDARSAASTSRTGSARSSWPSRYPGGAGPPGPGDRAAREGDPGATRRAGSTCRTSGSSTTGGCSDYQHGRGVVPEGGRRPGRARGGCGRWRR